MTQHNDLTDLLQAATEALHSKRRDDPAIGEALQALTRFVGGEQISTGAITGSTAVQVGKNLRMTIKQNMVPPELQGLVEQIAGHLDRWATDDYTGPERLIEVFVASPNDVSKERTITDEVIERFNRSAWLEGKARLKVIRWDHPHDWMSLPASMTWQEAVMREKAPSACDLVVVILWKKLGHKLPPSEVKPEPFRFETGDSDLPPERYLSGTEYEFIEAIQVADENDSPVVMVYRRDEDPGIKVTDRDFAQAYQQWQFVDTFFQHNFFYPDGSNRRGYTSYRGDTDFRGKLEKQIEREIARILHTETAPPDEQPEPIERWNPAICPFPGLRAFGPEYRLVFFGRDRERETLLERLRDEDFVAVVAASGSGKSSLVRAGVLPHVLGGALGEGWQVADCKPGEDPLTALAAALLRTEAGPTVPAGADFDDYTARLAERLHTDPDSVADELADEPLLLFIDQFEELFTLSDEADQQPFARALVALKATCKVILTVRADFVDRCLGITDLKPLFEAGTYLLYPPGRGQLREMIERPADMAGLHFEDDLAEQIWLETRDEPGALALTAYALEQLWEGQYARGDAVLRKADYAAFGGVAGAIGKQAHLAYERLDLPDERKQEAMRQVFARLVAVEPREDGTGYTATRRRADLDAVRGEPGSDTWDFVQALTDARLLTADNGILEVAHEALLRQWPLLKDWINQAGEAFRLIEDMKRDARRWRDTGSDSYLWTQERMDELHAELEKRPELDTELDEDRPLYNRFLRPEWLRIVSWLHIRNLSHDQRAQYGDRLAALNDPRPGVGVLREVVPLDVHITMAPMLSGAAEQDGIQTVKEVRLWGDKPEHIGLPDITFVKIVPDVDSWTMLDKDSKEYGPFPIGLFYIARYPLTYHQYRAFTEAKDGFNHPEKPWWNGLARTDDEPGEQNRPTGNHPAERVSWYDSIAFCRWLNWKLGWDDIPLNLTPDTLWNYTGLRLPAEWEWQYAAQNGDAKRQYPWGPDWHGDLANTSESRLSRTTAAGMYPAGATKSGILDMSGNVWEWCLNEYDKLENIALGGDASRVLRGGSWLDSGRLARVSHRGRNAPSARRLNIGFRVCVSGPRVS